MADTKTTTKTVKEAPIKVAEKAEKKSVVKAAPKSVKSNLSNAQGTAAATKFAVIKTGGKQYVVEEGRFYEFEKVEAEEGKAIIFDEVLLVADGGNVKIGEPTLKDSKVTGKVMSQFKDKKVVVLKYKPKKRYRKTTGHRQQKSKVMIETIK